MTERLYYSDAYRTSFDARVVDVARDGTTRVYLDRTAFYPTSGGQPHDVGELSGARVVDVIDEGERIAHVVQGEWSAAAVHGGIDWVRRYDFMQQHTGQHLLSALFGDSLGAATLSVHFGEEVSTLDVDTSGISTEALHEIERRANEVAWENRPVRVSFEDAAGVSDLRKAPQREGELRIVSIEGVDRSACGGTHVRGTSEIAPVLLRRTEKAKKALRIEFVCGGRALRRSRADHALLTRMAQSASTSIDELGRVFEAQSGQLREAESVRRRLADTLDRYRAAELYTAASVDSLGNRWVVERCAAGASLEDVRGLALRFAELPRAVFVAVTLSPPALLLAASDDSGVHAGEMLRAALAPLAGRGGGSARLAQGSVPRGEALESAVASVIGGVPAAQRPQG